MDPAAAGLLEGCVISGAGTGKGGKGLVGVVVTT